MGVDSTRSFPIMSRRDDGAKGDTIRGDTRRTGRKIRPQAKPLSVLEQKMMERTMQSVCVHLYLTPPLFFVVFLFLWIFQLKNNIVKKQIVMNKEFEGKSFITKPNVLIFDDFQIGGSYTKKVCLSLRILLILLLDSINIFSR
jgi:hypothetical protein